MWSSGVTPFKKKDHGLLELPVVALEALDATWKQAHSDKARQRHRQQRFGQQQSKRQCVPFACLLSVEYQLDEFIKSRF